MANTAGLRSLTKDDVELLTLLASVSKTLNTSYDLESVLTQVMDTVIQTLQAERGCIMLDRGGEVPEIAVARGLQPDAFEREAFSYSRTIVQQVLRQGEPILSHDAQGDERFAASRSVLSLNTRSIMCVPMRTRERTLGVIYLDNQQTAGLFLPTDLELLKIISDLAASAIERAHYFGHLVQSEKLAALGTLVAGIAHELNNPLASIMQCAWTAKEDKDSADEMTDLIVSEAERCRKLIRQLLGISRQEDTQMGPVSVSEVVASTAKLVMPDFNRDQVRLDKDVPATLPPIVGNAEQLMQVLLNLLTNARLALKGRSEAVVAVRAVTADKSLQLVVQDNGPGIPPEYLRRIFDPFFTSRPKGEGTGLGLSIVQRIVSEHGGSIEAHNDSRGGAVFTVSLPLESRPPSVANPPG